MTFGAAGLGDAFGADAGAPVGAANGEAFAGCGDIFAFGCVANTFGAAFAGPSGEGGEPVLLASFPGVGLGGCFPFGEAGGAPFDGGSRTGGAPTEGGGSAVVDGAGVAVGVAAASIAGDIAGAASSLGRILAKLLRY